MFRYSSQIKKFWTVILLSGF